MKILSVEQIRELDAYTIKHEPIASLDLMERASRAFTNWFTSKFTPDKSILVVVGTGNNGGDGLAIARMLHEKAYRVNIVLVGDSAKGSPDFKANLERVKVNTLQFPVELQNVDIIIDAIFGSGLSKPVSGIYAEAIHQINAADSEVVSIDIPSGLFADKHTDASVIVQANATVSFQLPKLAFLMPEAHKYCGRWHVVNIGLDDDFVDRSSTPHLYITNAMAQSAIKKTAKFDHKGSNGHALLVCGSFGKMGAALLAAQTAIRSGVGLLTVQVPKCGNDMLQLGVPEAMVHADENQNVISNINTDLKYSAVGIGPGLGKDPFTVKALKVFLSNQEKPIVLDADALNILSDNREMLQLVPQNSILTPHPKEFQRLTGTTWSDDFDRLAQLKQFANELESIVILKGAHTSIALPNGTVFFNSTGNPGMAKGGSGDVLTGFITGLLAQGYSSKQAAILGVYLHGLSGDMAKNQLGEIPMAAGDIIDYIPEAYAHLS